MRSYQANTATRLTSVLFLALAVAAIARSQSYTMVPLETPSGTLGCQVFDINNAGVCAGSTNIVGGDDRAVKWSAGSSPTITVLANIGTYGIARAYGINDAGLICGVGQNGAGQPFQPLIWSTSGSITNILPAGEYTGFAYKINAKGEVVGRTYGPGYAYSYPFKWDGTTSSNIVPGGGTNSDSPVAMNDLGGAIAHAYPGYVYLYANGSRTLLRHAYAATTGAINQAGQALWVENTGGPYYADILKLWNPDARNGTTGTIQDITPSGLATGYSIPYNMGINAYGDVCASFVLSGQNYNRAHVRLRTSSGAAWQDLNGLVTGGTNGWTLSYAVAINDKGQIACWGNKIVNGQTRQISFRLDPNFTVSR